MCEENKKKIETRAKFFDTPYQQQQFAELSPMKLINKIVRENKPNDSF